MMLKVVANMRKWVYDRVKPEICRWITYVRLHPEPQTFHSPDGDQLEQRRRAKSLEPRNERVSDAPSPSPRRTSRSKITPELSRENTVPRCARARSPSPLSQLLAQLSIQVSELKECDKDDWERYTSGSDGEKTYVPSNAATSDGDGYTTEESSDTDTDDDEPDKKYSSNYF
jgi:hypothetical protein